MKAGNWSMSRSGSIVKGLLQLGRRELEAALMAPKLLRFLGTVQPAECGHHPSSTDALRC